jgi:hydrophobic/amphiphilic exporter-1 (mainly G- bacteria), HAE1 family
VQADTKFRGRVDDIDRVYVRNGQGEVVPMRALARARLVQGPQTVVRYNGFRGAIVNGAAKPGYSSGAALAAMERVSAATLPSDYSFEWTGTALQEKAASGKTGTVLGLAVLFAYLFLVALYESWSIPIPALLSVSVAILGSIVAISLVGLSFDVYAQIGIVVLIALAAKNAILIIAFAVEQRRLGKDAESAAIEAAGLRFRPVIMTSFAFILGLLPLVIASGAGALTRHAVGTPVFGGMIAASFFGIFLIPLLYITAERLRGRKLEVELG